MPLILTPRQLAQRAELYQQLSQLTAAGIGLVQALEIQERKPPSRSFRGPLGNVILSLTQGATFSDSLQTTGNWLPAFDKALLHAGEKSGRLPACFKLLSEHYENSARLLRQMISGLLYPVLLFHMAIFIGPLPELFRSWNLAAYLAKIFGVLIPLYVGAAFVLFATQGARGERWRSVMESVFQRVPLLGKAQRNLALARLASALEALISAGVTIIEAWELAARASGSPALHRAVAAWKPQLQSGLTPSETLNQSGEFPELFANMYRTGEITGSLDHTLRKLYTLYQEEGARQLKAVADWTPKLFYFGVALMVAYQVIRFWTGYFDQINRAINF